MRIDNAGNVGIGTATPNEKLHVANTTATDLGLRIDRSNTNVANVLGVFDGLKLDGSQVVRMFTNGTEKMRVSSNGNVGIGTTTVNEKLEIQGSTANVRMKVENTSANGIAGMIFQNDARRYDFQVQGSDNDKLIIADNTAGQTRLTLDTSGNVGIGTTTPNEKLSIGGTAGVDGIEFPDGTVQTTAASGGGADYILIEDQKSNGTDGGTFTSGSFQTRDLNTIVSDDGGHASLNANQITLAAGTYEFSATAPAYRVDDHSARLQNITDATTVAIGSNARCGASVEVFSSSLVKGKFTIASSKAFELQHRCDVTRATDGFGKDMSYGQNEIYSQIEFRKVS